MAKTEASVTLKYRSLKFYVNLTECFSVLDAYQLQGKYMTATTVGVALDAVSCR